MGCLAQGHLSRDKKLNCNASSCLPTNPFIEKWVGIEPPTLWLLDDHTHHCATANPNTNVKMYDKNTHTKSHTNVWKKTRIHMYDKNTHTKSHTNVWQKRIQNRINMYEEKQAYKCITKKRIQLYDKNTHKNVWKKYSHILEWWTANYSAQGVWGALLNGTSAVTRRWTATPPAVCPPILLLISEWGLNRQPSGYWTTTLTTAPRPTQIQM